MDTYVGSTLLLQGDMVARPLIGVLLLIELVLIRPVEH
jgi:hypothetical protein